MDKVFDHLVGSYRNNLLYAQKEELKYKYLVNAGQVARIGYYLSAKPKCNMYTPELIEEWRRRKNETADLIQWFEDYYGVERHYKTESG